MLVRLLSIASLLCVGLAFAGFGQSSGYGSEGYVYVGYGDVAIQDTLATPTPAVEKSSLEGLNPSEAPLIPQGDGTIGYRASLQHSWLSFSNSVLDSILSNYTALGVSFGASKSFGKGNVFEFVPGMDVDLRLFWGEYTYLYEDNGTLFNRTRVGVMFSMDVRISLMARVNWKIFYGELGSQFGFNIFQSSAVDEEDLFGVANEDPALFIFSIVPGVGVRLKNTDIGIRLIPDITDCWNNVSASMMSIQFAVTFWY